MLKHTGWNDGLANWRLRSIILVPSAPAEAHWAIASGSSNKLWIVQ
jgi:hypothetical protein